MSDEKRLISFFKKEQTQIYFEFTYLVLALLSSCTLMLLIYFGILPLLSPQKCYLYSALGGFLGGWTYDAKWFFRVTARGKSGKSPWLWDPNKIYWRLLTPFISSVVGFAVYLSALTDVVPVLSITPLSGKSAFTFSYIAGYFSDIAIGKLADTADSLFGKRNRTKDLEE